MGVRIHFLGGAGTVTGSKYLFETDQERVLVDCGLFQGLKELRLLNRNPFPIDPGTINAIVLTHAHLDHSGHIPLLVKQGFKGQVHSTAATRDVAKIVLLDTAKIAEEDAMNANTMGYSRHKPAMPLYTSADAEKAMGRFNVHPTGKWVEVTEQIRCRFTPNGHILGSSFVELEYRGKRYLFSGDVGRAKPILIKEPEYVTRADVLIIESTYGDRLHEDEPILKNISRVITETWERRGHLIIPSFAVGRTQDLLWLIHQLRKQRKLPPMPIFLDSPMGIDMTDIFLSYPEWHSRSKKEISSLCEGVTLSRDQKQSHNILTLRKPSIVIAGSGMCTGGRVLSHLEKRLPDKRNTVLLVGFQAIGTRGRQLLEGASEVKMFGKYVPVNARIECINGLSAHADQGELLAWLKMFKKAPETTFLVHGEPQASDVLRVKIQDELGWNCRIPSRGQIAAL